MNETKQISSQVIEVEGGRQSVVQYEKRYTQGLIFYYNIYYK